MDAPKIEIPTSFTRGGLVIPRTSHGAGSAVIGDPCIVRDESISGYRMFLFLDPPGHGQAICRSYTDVGPGQWELLGPLDFTNAHELCNETTHKPFIVQEAGRPNEAAKINGKYCMVSVTHLPGARQKYVHQAWSQSLAGPWTWQIDPLIPTGRLGSFDDKHTDTVSGFYFPERRQILYYYMGHPIRPQKREVSPFGSAIGASVQGANEWHANKIGQILPPKQQPGHWASGYLGGLQLLPGKSHRWIALLNASPTAPNPKSKAKSREEPPPSLGGFAWCDEEFPITNWHFANDPIERVEEIPAAAQKNGEKKNLWRHHLLALPDGRNAIFYNAGAYGKEQLYMKWALVGRG